MEMQPLTSISLGSCPAVWESWRGIALLKFSFWCTQQNQARDDSGMDLISKNWPIQFKCHFVNCVAGFT